MPISELLLDSPVESFQVAIGLRVPGIIEEVDQVMILARLSEVLREFTAVIGLNISYRKRGHGYELPQEITAVSR